MTDATPRDPLAPTLARQRRDVTLLYATLADAIELSFARHATPDRPLTWDARSRILAEIGASLDVIYGRFRGDRDAALLEIIRRDTAEARFRPLDDAVRLWRREMPDALRDRVEADAGRGGP